MPFDVKMVICLEISSDILKEANAVIPAEEGELFIHRTNDIEIYASVGEVTDAFAEVELIGLLPYSVVYNGKMFRLPLGGSQSYPFSLPNGDKILVSLSYQKEKTTPSGKESICPSC